MNIPKSLTKASAIGALALNAATLNTSCDPGDCHITPNSTRSHELGSASEVRESCDKNYNQDIDCYVVSEDGDDILHYSTDCGSRLNAVLDKAFNPCIEDDDKDCFCYDGDGAEARCED